MKTKTCEICGKTLPLSAFSKSYKGRCKECVARLTKEKRNGTAATTHKPIDWEQRRYEIARDIMAASFCQPMDDVISIASYVHYCVQWADALIEELKKETK